MTVQNLATVFGPNILRPKVEDPVAIMEGRCSCCLFSTSFHRHGNGYLVTWLPQPVFTFVTSQAKAQGSASPEGFQPAAELSLCFQEPFWCSS